MSPSNPIIPDSPATLIDTPAKLAVLIDTGKLPLTCITCGNPVAAGATCEVDGTVAP